MFPAPHTLATWATRPITTTSATTTATTATLAAALATTTATTAITTTLFALFAHGRGIDGGGGGLIGDALRLTRADQIGD